MSAWLILAASIVCNATGNLLAKRFAMTTDIRGVRDYFAVTFVLGLTAFGISLVLYSRALTQIPIVVAYPVQVGSCVLIVSTFAITAFGERIGGTELLGIGLILAGIILLGRVST